MDGEPLAERKKHGGLRNPPGGRPRGSKSLLEKGAVRALTALRLRVPEKATPEAAELADETFGHIVSVMRRETAGFGTQDVLRAAAMVREEICGRVPQTNVVTGSDGGPPEFCFQVIFSAPKPVEPKSESSTQEEKNDGDPDV